MNTPARPPYTGQKLFVAAGIASLLAVCTTFLADSLEQTDTIGLVTQGCRLISKSMTAGDIDAILAGKPLQLDNPDGGYCFNPPTHVAVK
ncbi:hypothetical protein ABGT16_04580 [Pseudomonas asiatica]|uniref:hypothetical protein n=1 Tax=Pseudomonas asiatica TaxID=2219225 RepID=UPI00345D12D1